MTWPCIFQEGVWVRFRVYNIGFRVFQGIYRNCDSGGYSKGQLEGKSSRGLGNDVACFEVVWVAFSAWELDLLCCLLWRCGLRAVGLEGCRTVVVVSSVAILFWTVNAPCCLGRGMSVLLLLLMSSLCCCCCCRRCCCCCCCCYCFGCCCCCCCWRRTDHSPASTPNFGNSGVCRSTLMLMHPRSEIPNLSPESPNPPPESPWPS